MFISKRKLFGAVLLAVININPANNTAPKSFRFEINISFLTFQNTMQDFQLRHETRLFKLPLAAAILNL
jgi:hypothetical protein